VFMARDRDIYEPSFGTRLRWFLIIIAILAIVILVASAAGAFD
jgi:hypothetical protein